MNIFAIRRARLKMLVDALERGNISAFAARFGFSRAQISQFLSGTYNDGRSIGERAARTIEEKTLIDIGWLDLPVLENSITLTYQEAGETKLVTAKDSQEMAANLTAKRGTSQRSTVPVRSAVVAQGMGLIELRDAELPDVRSHVEFQAYGSDAYALLVKGSGLRPRVKSAEYLVIEPSLIARPGDDVLVKLASDECMLLQFLYTREDEITFGDFNENGPSASVLEADIVTMNVVAAILRSKN